MVLSLGGPAERVRQRIVGAASRRAGRSASHQIEAIDAIRPDAADTTAAQGWARSRGLTVVSTSRWQVVVEGSERALARAFDDPIAHARKGNVTLSRAARGLSVPPELRAYVNSVAGLDDRPLFSRDDTSAGTGVGANGADLRSAYGMDEIGGDGVGLTVAEVEFSGWFSSDLTTYAARTGLTLAPGQVTEISNGTVYPVVAPTGGSTEVALDSEAVLAVAPKAKQRIYVSGNDVVSALSAYQEVADDARVGLVQAVSISWGACETAAAAPAAMAQILQEIAAAGATVFAASGDTGASCSLGQSGQTYPASDPSVVAVGGTDLLRQNDGSFTEGAWVRSGADAASYGTGGGPSVRFPRPGYQSALSSGLGAGRLVPDIASDADPSTGFATYQQTLGGWQSVGGTSLAAPTQAALYVDALSAAGRTQALGDIHTLLYRAPSTDFRDIVSGTNTVYLAGPGYDLLTGRGSPDWSVLSNDLGLPDGAKVAPATAPAAPSANPGARAATVAWSSVQDPPDAPVEAYRVSASGGGGSVTVPASSTSAIVTGLSPREQYTFTVSSLNAAGSSPPSPPSGQVTPTSAPGDPGTISTVFGATTSDTSTNCSYTDAVEPHLPGLSDLTVGPDGALYGVTTNTVFRYDLATGVATDVAGACHATQPSYGDGGPATEANLRDPTALAFDAAGDLFVADTDLHLSYGLAAAVLEVDAATHHIHLIAGDVPSTAAVTAAVHWGGWIGQPEIGNGGPGRAATLLDVRAMSVGPDGALYIADSTGVRRLDLSSGIITQYAGGGQLDALSDGLGGPATSAQLNPWGLAWGSDGNLYVSTDVPRNTVDRIDTTTEVITAAVGGNLPGTAGRGNGDGGPLSAARLHWPRKLQFGPDGRLYIQDSLDDVIRRVDLANNMIETVAGRALYGGYVGSGDGGPVLDTQIDGPFAMRPDGDLYTSRHGQTLRKVVAIDRAPVAPIAANSLPGDAPAYSVVDVGFVNAVGITPSGVVAGETNRGVPFLWSDGQMQPLPGAPAGFIPTAVSAGGVVAGNVFRYGGQELNDRSFLVDGGRAIDVGPLADSGLTAVNDHDSALGGSYRPDGVPLGGTWNSGGWTYLTGGGYGLNDTGETVGDEYTGNGTRARLWCGTHAVELPTATGFGTARAISPSGVIVGDQLDSAGEPATGAMWRDGHFTAISTLGWNYAWMNAVNDAGDTVGAVGGAPSFGIRSVNGHTQFLDDLIDPDLGLQIQSAYGIDANGDILASAYLMGDTSVLNVTTVVLRPNVPDIEPSGAAGSHQPACAGSLNTIPTPPSGLPTAYALTYRVTSTTTTGRTAISLGWRIPARLLGSRMYLTSAAAPPLDPPISTATWVIRSGGADIGYAEPLTIDTSHGSTLGCVYTIGQSGGESAPHCDRIGSFATLVQPRNPTLTSSGATLVLRWGTPIAPNARTVLIRRLAGSRPPALPSDGTLIARTTGTSLTDHALRPRTTYCYSIWSQIGTTTLTTSRTSRCATAP